MRTIATLAAFVPLTLAGGAMAAEERFEDLDDFDAISYAVPYDVEFVETSSPYVALSGDQKAIDKLEVEVRRGRLYVSREDSSWFNWRDDDDDLEIEIGYESLKAITMAGSGDGHAEQIEAGDFEAKVAGSGQLEIDGLEADEVTVSIAGSGEIELIDVDAESVTTTISGSGNVKLTGTTISQSVTINGSGDHDARELQTSDTAAKIRGSGDVVVWANDELDATVYGSGDIDYYGAARVSRSVHGSGDLRHRGDAP